LFRSRTRSFRPASKRHFCRAFDREKIAFAQPRKKLSKNLTAAFPKPLVASAFANLGLDPNIRPHEAETSIYHHLYHELKDNLDGKQQSKQRRLSKSRAKNSTKRETP